MSGGTGKCDRKDTTIKNNLVSDPTGLKRLLGIKGHVNTTGNDGTVTRFGWKAQNKSLLLFAGEAYNVEMGITNEIFANEREEDPKCATNALAENHTDFDNGDAPADIVAFMGFMRFLGPTHTCMRYVRTASLLAVHRQWRKTLRHDRMRCVPYAVVDDGVIPDRGAQSEAPSFAPGVKAMAWVSSSR